MHETLKYCRYFDLCNSESNPLVYFLFNPKDNIYYVMHKLNKIYLHI